MKTIGASEFKTRCLALLDEVADSHETIVVLKRGRPVARLVPVLEGTDAPQAQLRGSVVSMRDLDEPPLASSEWEAESTR